MALWVDKYRPKSLADLSFHLEQAEQLKQLVSANDFPHLLVFGPPGSGKKTRIACILRELYGESVEKQKLENRQFDAPSGKHLEISVISSNYHIEMNPSDVGMYDRVVVQGILQDMAKMRQLDTEIQKEFKVVVLNEVDRLTRDAQHALRRTMEVYGATCRLIFCCRSTSKVIPPLRSRCLSIRVPAPSQDDTVRILNHVCKQEGVRLPQKLAETVALKSDGNLRRALLILEACHTKASKLTDDQPIIEPDWEVYLRETAHKMMQEQSPKRLLEIRGRLHELLVHCIPPDVIIRGLVKELLRRVDDAVKEDVVAAAAEFEHRLQLGTKPIFHLEGFVAKFMSSYKKFLETTLMNMG